MKARKFSINKKQADFLCQALISAKLRQSEFVEKFGFLEEEYYQEIKELDQMWFELTKFIES